MPHNRPVVPVQVHIHEADPENGWDGCPICPAEVIAVGFPYGSAPISIVHEELSDVGRALGLGDVFDGWNIEIVGLQLPRPSPSDRTPYPFLDDGKYFIQIWRKRILKRGLRCYIEERWHPDRGYESVMCGVLEASADDLGVAHRGRRLLDEYRFGRPPGTGIELAPEEIRAKFEAFRARMHRDPTQNELAHEIPLGEKTFKRNLKRIRETHNLAWSDLKRGSWPSS